MGLNFIGIVIGTSLLLGIWLGHVSVRKLEFHLVNLGLAAFLFFLGGIGCEIGALFISNHIGSAVLGVIGMTLIWDGLELFRQQKRVQRGHAAANPANPRHRRILEHFPTASTADPFAPYTSLTPVEFYRTLFQEKDQ
ncbi:MAG: DUF4491 family protein [Anaerolineales bacterium]